MTSDSNGSDEIGRFEAQYRENPDSLVFARLADACRKNGDPERALSILADGIRRHPDYPSAHIVRARCLVDLDRLADAEASLRRVIELDGQSLVAIQGLANLAERRDDPEEAVRWYEQIAILDPMNVEATGALERLRPTPPPPSSGLEPLPATSEEWWSSPDFQIEEEDAATPPEHIEPVIESVVEPAVEPPSEDPVDELPDGEPPADDPLSAVAEELIEVTAEPENPAREEAGVAWWFEDPGEDESDEDGDLLTRTMAELYTKQGLLDEAAAIYRELLTDRPDDEGLHRALDEVEQRLDAPDGEPADDDHEPVGEERSEGTPAGVEGVDVVATKDPTKDPTKDETKTAGETAAVRPDSDAFATHPIPPTSGTGEVLSDWLQRLAE